ncbi:phage tail tape measure protein [Kocuria sp. KH4]
MSDQMIGIRVGVDDDASGPLANLTQAAGQAQEALALLTRHEKEGAKAAQDAAKGTKQATDATRDQGRALTETDKAMGRYLDKAGRLREANGKYAKTGKQAERATRDQGDAHERAGRQAEQQARAVLLADRTIGAAMGHMAKVADDLERDWRVAFGRMDRETGVVAEALERARPRVVATADRMGREAGRAFAQQVERAVSGLDSTLGNLGVAGGAAGTGLAWLGQDNAATTAAASLPPGVDADDLKSSARQLYGDGYGTSFDLVTQAQVSILSTFDGVQVGSRDMQDLTRDVINVQDAFGIDPMQLSTSAGVMVNAGLAGDPREAMDLTVAALQNTPMGSRDELLEAMAEYSPFFKSIGLDGREALGILAEFGRQGPMAVDKAGDALKEFDVRAGSADAAQLKALGSLGIDQADVSRRLQAGDATALQDTVAALQGIPDEALRAQRAMEVFGTPLEDLSTAEVGTFLNTVATAPGILGDTAGAAYGLDRALDGDGRSWQALQNSAVTALAKLGDAAAPVLVPIIDMLGSMAWLLGPVAGALMLLWAGVKGYRAVTGVLGFLSRMGIGLGGVGTSAGGAKWGLRGLWGVLRANPLGLAALGVYGLAKGFAWLYENVEPVRTVVDGLVDVFGRVDEKLRDVGQSIEDLVRDKFPQLQGPMDNMETNLAGIDGGSWQKAIDGTSVGGNPLFSYVQDKTGLGEFVEGITPWRTKGEARAMGGTVGTTWGALPGYSPGVDNLMFTTSVPGVPYLALGGGEHIMRPEVDRVAGGFLGTLNHAAATHGTSGVRQVLAQPVLHRATGGPVGARTSGGGAVGVAAAPVVNNTWHHHITIAGDIPNARQKAQALRRELERVEAERARRNYGS